MKNSIILLTLCSILPMAAGCQKIAGNETPKVETVQINDKQKATNTIDSSINSTNTTPVPSMTPPLISVKQTLAKGMTLQAVGNGEKVKIAYGKKSKVINLEEDYAGDFTSGGESPHRYTTLLSIRQGVFFYLVARFRSGPAISDPNSLCGGDNPSTLLLIKADSNLSVETVQTEIFDSCIYNGAGRYPQGKPIITKNKILIAFEEGAKKYDLIFDAEKADEGLQLIKK